MRVHLGLCACIYMTIFLPLECHHQVLTLVCPEKLVVHDAVYQLWCEYLRQSINRHILIFIRALFLTRVNSAVESRSPKS